MLKYIQAVVFLFLASCQSSTTSKREADTSEDTVASIATAKRSIEKIQDTTGFLSNCQKWTSGASEGYLQGIEASKDSLGAFCFYECYDCKEKFEIIFVHR